MPDTPAFDLQHFVDAQEPIYAQVVRELGDGHKRTHWMWFIFPQLAGLGHSPMAQRYAISGLEEARAYLAHPVLGARLRECADLVSQQSGRSAHDIFGSPDDVKLRSSMTLFHRADPQNAVFTSILDRFCGGEDAATIARLAQ